MTAARKRDYQKFLANVLNTHGNAQQCGYLFKATMDIYDEERGKWTNCRAEVLATVYELKSPFLAD